MATGLQEHQTLVEVDLLLVKQYKLKPFFPDALDEKDFQVFIDGRQLCKVHFTIYSSL